MTDAIWREPTVIAALAAVVTLIITKLADGWLKKASFQMDDSALLRKDLMTYNSELREEIRQMAERVNAAERENSTLRTQVDGLRREIDTLNRQLGVSRTGTGGETLHGTFKTDEGE